jgi:hypothetical protein
MFSGKFKKCYGTLQITENRKQKISVPFEDNINEIFKRILTETKLKQI